MKRILCFFIPILSFSQGFSQQAGNPAECDSLDIVSLQYNPFDLNELLVVAQNNNHLEIFSYPGFKLINTSNDTVAEETVNYFGISSQSVHQLNTTLTGFQPGDVFSGELLLYTNFYDSLRCVFPVSTTLIPNSGCSEFYISTTDWSENIMQSIYWTITNEQGSVVESGEHDHTSIEYTLYDTVCLPNNNCYTLNITTNNPLEGNSDISITYLGFWVSQGSQMAQGTTQYNRDFSVYFCDSLLSVGQAEEPLKQVRLMPNPAAERLSVSWEDTEHYHTAEVFDLKGRRVMLEGLNAQRFFTLDIEGLHDGIYSLRLTGADGVVNRKFIKSER